MMNLPDMTALALAHESAKDHWSIAAKAQSKLNAEIAAAYKARFPKRREPSRVKLMSALGDVATARYEHRKAILQRACRMRDRRAERLDKILTWYAKRRQPVATDSPLEYDRSDFSTYRSQGYGCERYTRQAAEQMAAKIAAQGIKAEIVDWTYSAPDRAPYKFGYLVLAYTDRAGLEIIRRKPVSLKAWLQDCWNRGINPRVLNPFLPHDLEERLGVSYLPQSGRLVS